MDVVARTYKQMPLERGTLLVGVPHVGIGGTVLTDYILHQLQMDQVACLDSPMFPPFAMIHRGKPRFPVRIHADPTTRIAILRSELTPIPTWTRPLADAILRWAHDQGIHRIVVPDGLLVHRTRAPGRGARGKNPIYFVATKSTTRQEALDAGLREFEQGVVGGVPAMLLLEGRFQSADILTLLPEFHDALDDAQAAMAVAQVLPRFVPGLSVDLTGLKSALAQIEGVVRTLRQEAERVAAQAPRDPKIPMMYG